ncbi:DUF4179 domain-containing protein [Clostridium tarantellae]|uniref:DUF4179 domain-containing protein n=1 Tax=Clostridium tarantellae TaxID=39493 RepID=A0A6I1MTK2_9CLOT|nr:DUF4179 domain-containing protein [Clostridium tarantellae]MPQ43569.1 DUF4179 domain-containing protein [Clostridium tarantellae]
MLKDNDEKIIRDALNTINTPQSNIKLNVKNKLVSKKQPTYFRKAIIGVCAASLSVILCVPVMAASSSFQKLLSTINSNFELSNLKPIQTVSEDNGIKMEVVAAMNDNDMAVIYVTLQDLLGNRVDETVDFFDSYKFSQGSAFGANVVNYDEESKTATIRIQLNGGKKLSNKEIEFSFNKLLSGKVKTNTTIDNHTLKNIIGDNNIETVLLDMNNIPGCAGELASKYLKEESAKILKPNETNIKIPNVDFVTISNIGILNDGLHIQTKWNPNSKDEHGSFYFTNKLGEEIKTDVSNIHFGVDNNGNTTYGGEYIEYILDISNINMDEVNLDGFFVSSKNYTEGNWKANFKLQPVTEKKNIKCNLELEKGAVKNIELSPLGVTLIGKDFNEEYIKLNMNDGTTEIIQYDVAHRDNINKSKECKYIPKLPIDISKVRSIDIAGNIVNLH